MLQVLSSYWNLEIRPCIYHRVKMAIIVPVSRLPTAWYISYCKGVPKQTKYLDSKSLIVKCSNHYHLALSNPRKLSRSVIICSPFSQRLAKKTPKYHSVCSGKCVEIGDFVQQWCLHVFNSRRSSMEIAPFYPVFTWMTQRDRGFTRSRSCYNTHNVILQ